MKRRSIPGQILLFCCVISLLACCEEKQTKPEYVALAEKIEADQARLEKAWAAVKKVAYTEYLDRKERARLVGKFLEDYSEANPYEGVADVMIAKLERDEEPGAELFIIWIHSSTAKLDFTKSEVTVSQYRDCVEDGFCKKPIAHPGEGSFLADYPEDMSDCNFGNADRNDHPINCVNWNQATDFCEWAGGRLPKEDEWYAEASNGGKREYPWGDAEVTCDYAVIVDKEDKNAGCGEHSTWPVCSKPAGNSVSGLCDMSGNVWEWISSSQGSDWVARGGGWIIDKDYIRAHPDNLRASDRGIREPMSLKAVKSMPWNFGFRCVRAAPQ